MGGYDQLIISYSTISFCHSKKIFKSNFSLESGWLTNKSFRKASINIFHGTFRTGYWQGNIDCNVNKFLKSIPVSRSNQHAIKMHTEFIFYDNSSPRNICKTRSQPNRRVSRSGSVPNLATELTSNTSMQSASSSQKTNLHRSHRTASTVMHQRNVGGDCGNPLQADAFHFQQHLLSMADGTECQTVDDYLVTPTHNRIGDKTKRSDTAKRHVLSRQKPIQKDEHQTQSSIRYCCSTLFSILEKTQKIKFLQETVIRCVAFISQM